MLLIILLIKSVSKATDKSDKHETSHHYTTSLPDTPTKTANFDIVHR